MNVCPAHKNLVAAEAGKTSATEEDKLFNIKFDLADDEKTAHLIEIRANTPHPFSILFLGCQNWKDRPDIYCDSLLNDQAAEKACESNITDHVLFYISKWFEEKTENKPNADPVYFLAFTRHSDDEEIPQKITAEVKKTSEWLGISDSVIQCYVFYYTMNYLCNTLDLGTFRKKYDDLCKNPQFFFQCTYIPTKKTPQYLSVNEGSPRFTLKVQEM
jgi:hypothetical protein